MTQPSVDLRKFSRRGYRPGGSLIQRVAWLAVDALIMRNPLMVSYKLKGAILRMFGATIGKGVVIKPSVHIKYPWRLIIGDYAWIGEKAWIDNMADVEIGAHVVISQGVYLCTGNHDWTDPGMGLTPSPITIESGSWVGAFARVAPGIRVAENSVIGLGAVLVSNTERGRVYRGNPACEVAIRELGAGT